MRYSDGDVADFTLQAMAILRATAADDGDGMESLWPTEDETEGVLIAITALCMSSLTMLAQGIDMTQLEAIEEVQAVMIEQSQQASDDGE